MSTSGLVNPVPNGVLRHAVPLGEVVQDALRVASLEQLEVVERNAAVVLEEDARGGRAGGVPRRALRPSCSLPDAVPRCTRCRSHPPQGRA